jgi:hypothetical protein
VTLLQGDEPLPLDESGRPVATSTVTIRVDVPDSSAKALLERGRFEVMIFMDDFFLIEDEDSVVPFHFTLDLGRFPDGEHAILVNVAGYSDHVGAKFAPFRIERGR